MISRIHRRQSVERGLVKFGVDLQVSRQSQFILRPYRTTEQHRTGLAGSVVVMVGMMEKKLPEDSTQNRRNDLDGTITIRYAVPSRGLFMKQLRVWGRE